MSENTTDRKTTTAAEHPARGKDREQPEAAANGDLASLVESARTALRKADGKLRALSTALKQHRRHFKLVRGGDPRRLVRRVKKIGGLRREPLSPRSFFFPPGRRRRPGGKKNERGERASRLSPPSFFTRRARRQGSPERTSLNCRWCCFRAVDKARSLESASRSAVRALSTRDARFPLAAASGCSRSLPRAGCSAAAVVLRSVVFRTWVVP